MGTFLDSWNYSSTFSHSGKIQYNYITGKYSFQPPTSRKKCTINAIWIEFQVMILKKIFSYVYLSTMNQITLSMFANRRPGRREVAELLNVLGRVCWRPMLCFWASALYFPLMCGPGMQFTVYVVASIKWPVARTVWYTSLSTAAY